ncbi:MAG: hypothetical protein ACOYEA_07575 [Fermentimonas sp.]|jgi:hypothetical protein
MKRFQSLYLLLILVIFASLSLVGCRDEVIFNDIPDNEEEQQEIDGEFFEVSVPFTAADMKMATTRAMDVAGENQINAKDVKAYVFQKNETDFTYSYEAKVTKVLPANDDKSEGKLSILIKEGTGIKILFVVNALPPGDLTTGTTIDDFQKLFIFNQKQTWNAGELPMYAESEETVVVNHNNGAVPSLQTNPIHFLRAVARVDVVLGGSGDQFDKTVAGLTSNKTGYPIKITSVDAYNVANKGYAIPLKDSVKVENVTKAPKAIGVSIPQDVEEYNTETTISYSISNSGVDEFIRTIYIPEQLNIPHKPKPQHEDESKPEADGENYLKRPYLIIGVKGAVNGSPEEVTYFRVDYLDREGDEATAKYEYLDIIRNHRYLVNITAIEGPGFDKVEEAQKGPAANIMYNVLVWEESTLTNVLYDGEYMLGVSEKEITFDKLGGSITVNAHTSWPDGFVIEDKPDWLKIEDIPAVEGKDGKTDERRLTFSVGKMTDEEVAGGNRKQIVTIRAGRMRWQIKVTQKKDIRYEIGIFEDKECTIPLNFVEINQFGEKYGTTTADGYKKVVKDKDGKELSAENAVAYKEFYVKTRPDSEEPMPIIPDIPNNPFKVEEISELGLPDGVTKYKVTAEDITERAGGQDAYFEAFNAPYRFAFKESDAGIEDEVDSQGRPTAKITFLQKEYDALPYSDKQLMELLLDDRSDNMYLMDGNEHNFYIKANTPFNVKLLSMTDDNEQSKGLTPLAGDPNVVWDPNDWAKYTTPNEVKMPSLKGTPITFRTADDLTNPSIYHAVAKFMITSPYGYFPDRVFEIELVSALIQPEANTYMIKAGAKQGILIPVSRVNTARDYYEQLLNHDEKVTEEKFNLPGTKEEFMLHKLDDDDVIVPEVLWTDIHNTKNITGERIEGDDLQLSGLEHLKVVVGTDGKRYVHVQAGNIPGNVLISIQSSKINSQPTLWSWHIWIVNEYPEVRTIEPDVSLLEVPKDSPIVHVMSHLIGAEEAPSEAYDYKDYSNDGAYKVYGMQYQWGRKDPFPSYGLYAAKQFYTGDGKSFDFPRAAKGTRNNIGIENALEAAGATYTMKASIENPHSIVSHQTFWQYELFPFKDPNWFSNKWTFLYLWNKVTPENENQLDPEKVGGKTVFDPSPYGFRIMSQAEAVTLRSAYYSSGKYSPNFYTPLPGAIYDGNYQHRSTGGKHAIFAVSQGRKKSYAGRYLINTTGGRLGWAPGSNTDDTYRRSLTVSVRPVIDPEVKDDYTKFLPQ